MNVITRAIANIYWAIVRFGTDIRCRFNGCQWSPVGKDKSDVIYQCSKCGEVKSETVYSLDDY